MSSHPFSAPGKTFQVTRGTRGTRSTGHTIAEAALRTVLGSE